MRTVVLSVAVFVIGASGTLIAQSPDVVGTWKLLSASATTTGGERNDISLGPNPKGLLIYSRDGKMTVIISQSGRKLLSGSDRFVSPPNEQAAAFVTFFAYGGRYSVTGDKITHHVEVASVENWVNTDLVRIIKIEGDRMTLITPTLSVRGRMQTTELVWERLR